MQYALNDALSRLPPDTLVYCGHGACRMRCRPLTTEYTKSNAAFSAAVIPDYPAIQKLVQDLRARRNSGVTTGLYTIAQEREHNPFMMTSDAAVQKAMNTSDPVSTMKALRDAKNAGSMRTNI